MRYAILVLVMFVTTQVSLGASTTGSIFNETSGGSIVASFDRSDAIAVDPSMSNATIQAKLNSTVKADMVTNGNFSSATGWSSDYDDTGWTISGGVATCAIAGSDLYQTVLTVVGRRYLVSFEVSGITFSETDYLDVRLGTGFVRVTAAGKYIRAMIGDSTKLITFSARGDNTAGMVLDNVRVQEVPKTIQFFPGAYIGLDLEMTGNYQTIDASGNGVLLSGSIESTGSDNYLFLYEHGSGEYPAALTLTGLDDTALYLSGRRYKSSFDYSTSRTLTLADNRKIITNSGATGAVTYTLDTYTVAMEGCIFYIFDVDHTAGRDISITLADTTNNNIIMPDDGLAASGDRVTLAGDRNQCITIIAIDNNYHIVGYTGSLTEG